jgi:arylsulfatase A-like enzyme
VQALADAGVTDNTLLVFTNDNGGEQLSRNVPLFNRQGTVWEGGIRVPAIMKWPGVIPSVRVTDQVGMNLLPTLTGESLEVERTLFWRGTGQRNRAVHSGDWKSVIQDLSWGTASFVYNVQTDMGERDDVARYRPEVARRLRGLLNDWEAEVNGEAEARGIRTPG